VWHYQQTKVVGEALDVHLETIIIVDDEWRDLIVSTNDEDLKLKLKMRVLDGISGCVTGIGNVCPAVVLHRSGIDLVWLADDGGVQLLSVKEMVRRGELLYAYTVEPPDGVRLLRLQTYRPLEPRHSALFDGQFENLWLELYEALYISRGDVERWRRITRAATLPEITRVATEATRRYVMEFCVFGDYNVCPGILLTHGDRVDVRILRISAKAENYVARIDLAGLLANRQPPVQPSP
jgi:hypothetical protein